MIYPHQRFILDSNELGFLSYYMLASEALWAEIVTRALELTSVAIQDGLYEPGKFYQDSFAVLGMTDLPSIFCQRFQCHTASNSKQENLKFAEEPETMIISNRIAIFSSTLLISKG